MKKTILSIIVLTGLIWSCRTGDQQESTTKDSTVSETCVLDTNAFRTQIDGKQTDLYFLKNANGMEMAVTNYGGIIVSLKVPDRSGKLDDIVLGFPSLEGYQSKEDPYFGTLIGRFGNRIAKAKFKIAGKEYQVPVNNGQNALHGGVKSFSDCVWDAELVDDQRGESIKFSLVSEDGDQGYPGKLTATVTYTLTNNNELIIEYGATTDKPTIINLTQHSYFNLSGMADSTILDHELTLYASKYTPVDSTLIPTGELMPVKETPMDFTVPKRIGEHVDADYIQLAYAGGYDHNWVLDKKMGEMSLAATLYHAASGRIMEVSTNEPGIQFYCGNFLDGTLTGKCNMVYKHRAGLCLETQHFPDSPNQPKFPSTLLKPGQTYSQTTVFKFSTK